MRLIVILLCCLGRARPISVGIDLGTSRSCVAHVDAATKKASVVANAAGELTTASVVEVGGHVMTSWKRAIGLSPKVARGKLSREFAMALRLDLSEDTEEDREVEMITGLKGGGRMRPSEASTLLLKQLVGDAAARLGEVKNAVIGVPAMFDAGQRDATMQAATAAGLEKILLVPEPELAAYAYGVDIAEQDEDSLVLVFDLGGGTLDVTILKVGGRSRTMELVSTRGDTLLGGIDFTNALADLASTKARVKLTPQERAAFETEAERAKLGLSSEYTVEVAFDSQKVEISREEFEIKCEPILLRCERLVRECAILVDVDFTGDLDSVSDEDPLKSSNRKQRENGGGKKQNKKQQQRRRPTTREQKKLENPKPTIENVVLVGAATKMPMVSQMLQSLAGVTVHTPVDPEHAVALGAATRAAMNDGVEEEFVVLSQWKAEILRALAEQQARQEEDKEDHDAS